MFFLESSFVLVRGAKWKLYHWVSILFKQLPRFCFIKLHAPFANNVWTWIRFSFDCTLHQKGKKQTTEKRSQAEKRLLSDTKKLIINSIKTNKKDIKLKQFSSACDSFVVETFYLIRESSIRKRKAHSSIIELSWMTKHTEKTRLSARFPSVRIIREFCALMLF